MPPTLSFWFPIVPDPGITLATPQSSRRSSRLPSGLSAGDRPCAGTRWASERRAEAEAKVLRWTISLNPGGWNTSCFEPHPSIHPPDAALQCVCRLYRTRVSRGRSVCRFVCVCCVAKSCRRASLPSAANRRVAGRCVVGLINQPKLQLTAGCMAGFRRRHQA